MLICTSLMKSKTVMFPLRFRSFALYFATALALHGLRVSAGLATAAELDPYSASAVAADLLQERPAVVYTRERLPVTPNIEDLALKQTISQFGISWTFDKPVRIGQFVNGDYYIVGSATVTNIDPKPLYGRDVPESEVDANERERRPEECVRNGFMLNPPAAMKVAYDSGVRNWFDPALVQRLPVRMKPGDSLVSSISMPKGLVLRAQLRNKVERGVEDSSPIRMAAVLTCVAQPEPPDAFRPGFCDRTGKIYLARDLQRNRLPSLDPVPGLPGVKQYIRFTQRPWVGTCFFGFEEPVENMPQYGLEYGRVAGITALMLCTRLSEQDRETLLVNYLQVGIDLAGMVRAGHPGWTCWGGHGSGRKLPIVFAGLLLGDESLATSTGRFPRSALVKTSRPRTARPGRVLTLCSPGIQGSTPRPGRGETEATAGDPTSTHPLQNGRRDRIPANRIGAVARVLGGLLKRWRCI